MPYTSLSYIHLPITFFLLLLSTHSLSLAVGEQLTVQLSAVGAQVILSDLPTAEAALVELKRHFARQEDVR